MSMPKFAIAAAGAILLVGSAPATAAVPHSVQAGETLWGIAMQSNLTTRALAVFNGLNPDGYAIAGTTVMIPTVAEASVALAAAEAAAVPAPAGEPAAPPSVAGASHLVQWGETLSGIATAAGLSTESLAAANGLDPAGVLLAGTTLTLAGAPASATTATMIEPVAETPAAPVDAYGEALARADAARQDPSTEPIPTPGKVTAEEIAGVAAEHGVSPSLASAVAWHESGFENGLVSTADARGVMQILPSTWNWIKTNLAPYPLDPTTSHGNVHAGVLYLRQLLDETGGDEGLAAAGYYQGLASVRERGLYEDTQAYVDNVLALKSRFGG